MFINPQTAIKEGWITTRDGYSPIVEDLKHSECQIQQNGIDLRIDNIQMITGGSEDTEGIVIGHTKKVLPKYTDPPFENNFFSINPGYAYAFDCMEYINVPEKIAAMIFVRSTLNRIGAFVTSGLWDSGFHGALGGVLRSMSYFKLEKGTRICQVVFVEADSFREYDGIYKGQQDQRAK